MLGRYDSRRHLPGGLGLFDCCSVPATHLWSILILRLSKPFRERVDQQFLPQGPQRKVFPRYLVRFETIVLIYTWSRFPKALQLGQETRNLMRNDTACPHTVSSPTSLDHGVIIVSNSYYPILRRLGPTHRSIVIQAPSRHERR